jgi:hypothetical protein
MRERPDNREDTASTGKSGRRSGEVREHAAMYGAHGAERDVILAGLGAKARAREKGDGSFWDLVEAGEKLETGSQSDSELAEESRDMLAFAQALDRVAGERRAFRRMIEAMLPAGPLPTSPAVLQARRNAEARLALIEEFGLLASADIARLAESRAKNTAALANRWKQEGWIFSVPYQGAELFPAFQFDEDGRPLPVIARVLETLGRQSRGWELALWFLAANGWLEGDKRPVDLVRSAPEDVAQAAEREAEGLLF